MHPTALAAAVTAVVALGCASTRAYSDFDPNARFESYRTFAWIGEEPGSLAAGHDPGDRGVDPLLARRIRATIERQLAARGYRQVESLDAADFVVTFSVGAREKIQVDTYPVAGGWYGGWYATSGVSARSYTEGTLSIDVFDGESHQAVWHGWASQAIRDSTDRARLVEDVVTAILAKFPPQR
jgi:hypothetical protein